MRVMSSASSRVRRGRMLGVERASRVLPAPGGPIINTLYAQFSCTVYEDRADVKAHIRK